MILPSRHLLFLVMSHIWHLCLMRAMVEVDPGTSISWQNDLKMPYGTLAQSTGMQQPNNSQTCLLFSAKETSTETEMSSFWRKFHYWLHRKLSKWQLLVQPVMNISPTWRISIITALHWLLTIYNKDIELWTGKYPVKFRLLRFNTFWRNHLSIYRL